jgi:regulatory protein
MFAQQQLSLKGRALRALAGREHSRVELERKLASFEEEPGQLAKLLDELQAKGFLDDQRAADSLANHRGRKLGTARVVQEMRARGIEPEAIAQSAEQLRATELERAHQVWLRKFGQVPAEPSQVAKQIRFLMARGFSAEVVRRVLSQADKESAANEPTD